MGAARKAWNAVDHPRGPGGKFASKGSGGSSGVASRGSLGSAVIGTAAGGPKRQRQSGHEQTPWRQLESGPSKGPLVPKNSTPVKRAPTPNEIGASSSGGSHPQRQEPFRWPQHDGEQAAASEPRAPKPAKVKPAKPKRTAAAKFAAASPPRSSRASAKPATVNGSTAKVGDVVEYQSLGRRIRSTVTGVRGGFILLEGGARIHMNDEAKLISRR